MKKKITVITALCCALILIAAPAVNALLTPGMEVLEEELSFIKSGVVNNDIYFTKEDFINTIGAKKVSSVTVLSLPDASSGTLRLGEAQVYENQSISAECLELLNFSPCADVLARANFDVSVNTGNEEYTLTCEIKMTEYFNATPVIADTGELSLRTKENVTYYGKLAAEDAEKDALIFEITKPARHGTVSVTDPVGGSFKYTPSSCYTGKDSFTYRVSDEFGNYSDTAKVSVTVEKNSSGVFYCDMTESWAHNDAITLAEEGVMVGQTIGKQMLFGPDYRVSRAEFLAMAMDVCGIAPDPTLTKTDFTDNDQIPEHLISYVATAKKLGYIDGTKTDEGVFFYPNNTITRAEAAVIINKMLDLQTSGTVSVFNDDHSIPAWAEESIYALTEHGLLSGTGMGAVSANEELTRDQAATVLCSVLEYNG